MNSCDDHAVKRGPPISSLEPVFAHAAVRGWALSDLAYHAGVNCADVWRAYHYGELPPMAAYMRLLEVLDDAKAAPPATAGG